MNFCEYCENLNMPLKKRPTKEKQSHSERENNSIKFLEMAISSGF